MKSSFKNRPVWKVSSILTCFLMLFYTSACYAPKILYTESEIIDYQQKHSVVQVFSVEKISGDIIQFHENYPGSLTSKGIRGKPTIHIEFNTEDSIVISDYDQKVLQVIMDENKRYNVISVDEHGYVCANYEYITIPLAEIRQINVKTANVGTTNRLSFWDIYNVADWIYYVGASSVTLLLIVLFILKPYRS